MEFRTPVNPPPAGFRLHLSSRILTLGSCFAEAMGGRLAQHKFDVCCNPFGTVFNPVSLARLLRLGAGLESLSAGRLVQAGSQWQHHDFHSRFGADTAPALLAGLQAAVARTAGFLAAADCLVLTLGTAVAYRLPADGQVVSNCHKVPAAHFDRHLIPPDEAVRALGDVFAELLSRRPELRIVLTVSPVRHVRDTLPLNGASKAVLRVACQQLSDAFAAVSYFPAYEIMLDDLRDYRFYKADMIHPSEVAEDYIWQQFLASHATPAAQAFVQAWAGIRRRLAHRPFREASEEYRRFLQVLLEDLERLSAQADVRPEQEEVRNRLAAASASGRM